MNVKNKQTHGGFDYWDVVDFTVQQLVNVSGLGYEAIYVDEEGDSPYLVTCPLHFIAVAQKTITTLRRPVGSDKGRPGSEVECVVEEGAIVAIVFNDGSLEVANDDDNFGGIKHPDVELRKCLGNLDFELYEKIPEYNDPESSCNLR